MIYLGKEIIAFIIDYNICKNEFKNFIGESIRLDPVIINKETSISEMLSFYMGKNTPQRQNFIIDNLSYQGSPDINTWAYILAIYPKKITGVHFKCPKNV